MEQIFGEVLNMSITAGYCIVAVLLLRLLLQKFPKIYSYLLWSVVGFRLVCPISIKSAFSLIRIKPQDITAPFATMEQSSSSTIGLDLDEQGGIVNQIETGWQNFGQTTVWNTWQEEQGIKQNVQQFVLEDMHQSSISEMIKGHWQSILENPLQSVLTMLTIVWIIVAVALIIYSICSMSRLKKRLKRAVHVDANIYEAKNLPTPFVFGIFRPKIYLPEALQGEDRNFVLLHENTHIRRRDYLIKQVAFFIVCIHWFNPLVWAAFHFMCQDMEMSCDESVIRLLGKEKKPQYSAALLSLASGKKIELGSPLAFGEGGIKKRIVNILNYKRLTFWVSILLVVILSGVLVGLSLNPQEEESESFVTEQVIEQTDGMGKVNSDTESEEQEKKIVDSFEASADQDDFQSALFYQGYLDESPYTTWNQGWKNCDFDADGIMDRIYREASDEGIAYRIEFGNGDILEVGRSGDHFMDLKIKSADICGDANKEILFVGEHTGSTDPYAASDISLFEKTADGYKRILLPGQDELVTNVTGYGTTLYDNGDGTVRLECPEANFEADFVWDHWLANEYYNQEEFFEISGNPVEHNTAYNADLINYAGDSYLILYQNVCGKWLLKDVGFIVKIGDRLNSEAERELVLENVVIGNANLEYGLDYVVNSWVTDYANPRFSMGYDFVVLDINSNDVHLGIPALEKVLEIGDIENLNILMSDEVTPKGKIVELDKKSIEAFLDVIQNKALLRKDVLKWSAEYYILIRDNNHEPIILLELWNDYVCVNGSVYYEITGSGILPILDEIFHGSTLLPQITPEEILLSYIEGNSLPFTQEDIFLYNGNPALIIGTGVSGLGAYPDEYYYEQILVCEGKYFDKEFNTTYLIALHTIWYNEDGTILDGTYDRHRYYDYITGELTAFPY